MTFARRIDGAWELRGLGTLRTLRLDRRLGWPDLNNSSGVAGVTDTGPGRYVALSGEPEVTLALTSAKPAMPHLVSANAQVVSWKRDGHQDRLPAARAPAGAAHHRRLHLRRRGGGGEPRPGRPAPADRSASPSPPPTPARSR